MTNYNEWTGLGFCLSKIWTILLFCMGTNVAILPAAKVINWYKKYKNYNAGSSQMKKKTMERPGYSLHNYQNSDRALWLI